MALVKELETRICLVWKTERPFKDRPRKSNEFSLIDSAWYLQMNSDVNRSRSDRYYYAMSLRQGTKRTNLKKAFRVTTFIEDQVNHNFSSIGCSKNVETTDEVIWEFDEDVVSKKTRNFNDYGEWRIVCLFHGVPSMLQTKIQTIHLSTQTDLISNPDSLAVDKQPSRQKKKKKDVTIKCGGCSFYAHRSILAELSEVFAAMFRSKMMESETGVVEVTDLEAPVLELLLKYAYRGKVTDLTEDMAPRLFAAGDKYAMYSLKMACADWMIRNLTEENCIGFLTVANVHSDPDFKDAVISFICDHESLLESEEWVGFSEEHSKLAVEVYRKVFRVKLVESSQKAR